MTANRRPPPRDLAAVPCDVRLPGCAAYSEAMEVVKIDVGVGRNVRVSVAGECMWLCTVSGF